MARRRLGRSLAIRQVIPGSCDGCELEMHAPRRSTLYDLERFGLCFVRLAPGRPRRVAGDRTGFPEHTPRALERTLLRRRQTPNGWWRSADCAFDGGIFSGSYAVVGGVNAVVPVDLHIAGCPPTPLQLLKGLISLLQAQP